MLSEYHEDATKRDLTPLAGSDRGCASLARSNLIRWAAVDREEWRLARGHDQGGGQATIHFGFCALLRAE